MNIFDEKRDVTDRAAVVAAVEKLGTTEDIFGDDAGEEMIQMGSDFEDSGSHESASDAPEASAADATPSAGDEPSPPPAAEEKDEVKEQLQALQMQLHQTRRENEYWQKQEQARRQAEHQQQYQQQTGVQHNYDQYDPRVVALTAYEAAQQAQYELHEMKQEQRIAELRSSFAAVEREYAQKNSDLDKHINPEFRKMALQGMERAIRDGKTIPDLHSMFDSHYSRSKLPELRAENEQLKSNRQIETVQGKELQKLQGIPQSSSYQQPAPNPEKDKAKSKIGMPDYRNAIAERARQLFRAG
jgi:hypothetical protein